MTTPREPLCRRMTPLFECRSEEEIIRSPRESFRQALRLTIFSLCCVYKLNLLQKLARKNKEPELHWESAGSSSALSCVDERIPTLFSRRVRDPGRPPFPPPPMWSLGGAQFSPTIPDLSLLPFPPLPPLAPPHGFTK